MRLRIFVDYWNFLLSVNEFANNREYKVDWKKLSPWILQATRNLIDDQTLAFEETHVYMSYNPNKDTDKGLKDWAINTLDRFPGIQVFVTERKFKSSPKCPVCHQEIAKCPSCTSPTNGTTEKGVDATLVTDLISLAWENAWDVAVLLSSDRDYIPAVKLLRRKGYKVINAHFPREGFELTNTCWGDIDISASLSEIALIK